MSYAESLVEGADSRGFAFLSYVNQKARFPRGTFVFVEDKDDISFYSHFTQDVGELVFIPSGGKTQVFELFHRLGDDIEANGNIAFIVDRDLDEGPVLAFEADILRTTMYSWESHTSSQDVLEQLMATNSNPRRTADEISSAKQFLTESQLAFSEVLYEHSAAVTLSASRGGGFEMEKVPLLQGHTVLADRIEPGAEPAAWLQLKLRELVGAGVDELAVQAARTSLRAQDLSIVAHGRVFFRIFKLVAATILGRLGGTHLVNSSSPLELARSMPPNWAEIEYVRRYLRGFVAA